jgi:hypothetical protein
MNIDLSRMTHAVVHAIDQTIVYGLFPSINHAEIVRKNMADPKAYRVVPITPPAPKYPEAERPTHCVQSPVGVTYVLGNESSCIRWKDKYGNEEYFVATCSHWWTNEGGGE